MKMSVKTEAIIKTILQIISFLCAVGVGVGILYLLLTTESVWAFLEVYLPWIVVSAFVIPMVCAGISVLYECNLKNAKARREAEKKEDG